MSKTVIKIENLSKIYRLGELGTGTLSHDLNRWVRMNIMGQEDPYAKVGHVNDRTQKAEKGELVAALRDINLEVKEGEVLGIIGKNGAGKSTLLKLLSRVTSPTTGSIKVKGRLASLLEVGTGFHPEMTGRENIYMNGTIMGMRKWEIDRKLDEIVEFAGVAKYLDTPTKRYSSGMTVRLGFAIAAHLEPEILVVDEVLAVGDAEFQKKAIGKMQDVSQNQGRTVLFVSHNMAAVSNLCNKGILINNGEITKTGNIENVVTEYLISQKTNSNNIPIKDRTDRIGTKEIQFTDIIIQNKDNLKTGSNLKVEIFLNKHAQKYDFVCSIYANNDSKIAVLETTNNSNLYKFERLNENKIICNIPKIPLLPGEYYINLAIYSGTTIIDLIKYAVYFEIHPGEYNGILTGSKPDRGQIIIEHSWIK